MSPDVVTVVSSPGQAIEHGRGGVRVARAGVAENTRGHRDTAYAVCAARLPTPEILERSGSSPSARHVRTCRSAWAHRLLPPWKMQANSGVSVKAGDMLDGRYTLRDCIAQGGMGRVYLAEQPALERIVAIKLLQPELAPRREYARCIRDEAIAASRVRDPRCVKVLDCGALPDGTPYLVMEHIPGRSLRDLSAEGPIPAARAIELVEQVLGALGATHDAGIVHADVKSDNFLVESVAGADRVTMI